MRQMCLRMATMLLELMLGANRGCVIGVELSRLFSMPDVLLSMSVVLSKAGRCGGSDGGCVEPIFVQCEGYNFLFSICQKNTIRAGECAKSQAEFVVVKLVSNAAGQYWRR